MNSILVIISCLFCLSCHVQSNTTFSTMTAKSNRIARKLANDSYGDFFNYLIQDQIIATVWAEAGGVAPLKAIVLNEGAPTKARLLACHVLMKNDFSYLRDEDVKINRVAAIYTDALANNITGMANSWGFLYKHKHDAFGPVGPMLFILGEEAIPELVKLLDNETIHLYHGSEAATVGNAYRFRVKDFAAYYICRIKNIMPVYHETHAARDAEIEKLKLLLVEE